MHTFNDLVMMRSEQVKILSAFGDSEGKIGNSPAELLPVRDNLKIILNSIPPN